MRISDWSSDVCSSDLEAGRVPQLVAEVLVALGARQVELDVAARAGQRGHGEAQRVGAVGVDAGGELLARGLLDPGRVLRLPQPRGALGDQRVGAGAVDDVERAIGRASCRERVGLYV